MTYKEFSIAKKSGKQRKIVAPDDELKTYQRSRADYLKSEFDRIATEAGVQHVFHGFYPGRNCVTAATEHIGYEATVLMDLSNFFDTVTKTHTSGAGCILTQTDYERLFHKEGYAAQGFPSSPMLCNIAIIKAVRDIVLNLDFAAVTVYADDIAISFNDTSKENVNLVKHLVTSVFSAYGFSINPSKTRVRFAKYGHRRILGVNVSDSSVIATRKTMRKLRAVKHLVKSGKVTGPVVGGLQTWSQCMYPKKASDYAM